LLLHSSGISCPPLFKIRRLYLNKFNFVNSADSIGHFSVWHSQRVSDTFKPTNSLKWVHSSTSSNATLSLEGCMVIAPSAINGEGKITFPSQQERNDKSRNSTHSCCSQSCVNNHPRPLVHAAVDRTLKSDQ